MDERLLVLQPGIRAVPLSWESQLQDPGPQETSQLHVIPNDENLSRSPSQHQDPASLNDQQATVLDTLCQTTSKTGTQPHPLADSLPKIIRPQTPQNTPDLTNEEEIGSLPEKEFRIMIVKMIQNLGNRIDKMQETFNKDVEELKRNQETMKNTDRKSVVRERV